jgi:hypothetical protein
MDRNTFATSAYIAAPLEQVFSYLCDLEKLNEWTLNSRMRRKVAANTWLGTASGYQRELYYHLRVNDMGPVRSIEWHCGFEVDAYFQVYPVFLFPPSYLADANDEPGVYFHWLSFVDPRRRTPMIEQGIGIAHRAECRSLKAILERKAGLREYVEGAHEVLGDTIYIAAPFEMAAAYLADARRLGQWSHLLKLEKAESPHRCLFRDEYGRPLAVSLRATRRDYCCLVEQSDEYDAPRLRRSVTFLIRAAYALGDPAAKGCFFHRITFWPKAPNRPWGKVERADYQAEMINAKRQLEMEAGDRDAFDRGLSYVPRQSD